MSRAAGERGPVLVTGGAGYVGSHACKALAAAGFRPVTLDNLSTGHAWAVQWGPLERLDIRDGAALDAAVRRHRPRAVLHFAAASLVGESVRDPLTTYDVNLAGTLRLVESAWRHSLAAVVFSSSAAVYGAPAQSPIAEDAPCRPVNPYGASKHAAERLLADQAQAGGPAYAALRYFNAAGADPEGALGEAHQPETHLIPLAIRAARDPNFALTVFGRDYPTPDGTAVRDFVHVADLAEAHVRALEHLLAGGDSLVLNLGTGRGHSVREVVDGVGRVTGQAVKLRDGPRRAGDPAVLVAAADRAAAELGWRPRWTELDAILATAVRWHARSSATDAGDTGDTRETDAPAG